MIFRIDEVDPETILYEINGFKNHSFNGVLTKEIVFRKYPVSIGTYAHAFDAVMKNLKYGNSYLTNLTFPTPIEINLSLKEIFQFSRAPYKLLVKDQFVVFSPEIFIQIRDGRIYSHPMKGTMDASIPNAEERLLKNQKEHAEHVTIVDLIRNDLSMVANDVRVDRFRYIDRIQTNQKEILQVSSQISGTLTDDYASKIGDLLGNLLPAGSICGAPKQKTVEIIRETETYQRLFYTGVFGYFDGKNLDCGVMIRFIENQNGQFVFKSGGGITVNSDMESEYSELIDKVYVPIV